MPGMKGPALIAKIREYFDGFAVLLMSSMDQSDLEVLAKECKSDAALTKSASPDAILTLVNALLARRA
jgi:DNA-binding response OmpR family regulator